MRSFLSLHQRGAQYKLYKRAFNWTPADVIYNVKLIRYYQKFIEFHDKIGELSVAVAKATDNVSKNNAVAELQKFRVFSRLRLTEIKNECT